MEVTRLRTLSEDYSLPAAGAAAAFLLVSLDSAILVAMFVVILAAFLTYLFYHGSAEEPTDSASGPSTRSWDPPAGGPATGAPANTEKAPSGAGPKARRATPYLAVAALLVVAGVAGYGLGSLGLAPASSSGPSAPYRITLVETMNNMLGGAMQPMFQVVTPEGLGSSANISLPAHTLIAMTIVSYDTPTPGSSGAYSNVTGTVGNLITLVNGTNAAGSSNASMGSWESVVSSIPASQLAHTFTVSALGVNIPVEGGFTELAYFYVNETGSFTWICMTPCGTGPNGTGGAMTTPGWMTGTLSVQ